MKTDVYERITGAIVGEAKKGASVRPPAAPSNDFRIQCGCGKLGGMNSLGTPQAPRSETGRPAMAPTGEQAGAA
jgi:hypothetical protein